MMIQEDFYLKKGDENGEGDLSSRLRNLSVNCSSQAGSDHKGNHQGYIVEEIAEEIEPYVPEPESTSSVNIDKGSVGDMGSETAAATLETKASSVPVELDQSRREFGNISPISDVMSQSDEEEDTTVPNNSLSSTTPELSLLSRLNCSSPILAHSPSLRKTPVLSITPGDKATPPSIGGGKRVRNFARALDDISDHEHDGDDDSVGDGEEEELVLTK